MLGCQIERHIRRRVRSSAGGEKEARDGQTTRADDNEERPRFETSGAQQARSGGDRAGDERGPDKEVEYPVGDQNRSRRQHARPFAGGSLPLVADDGRALLWTLYQRCVCRFGVTGH